MRDKSIKELILLNKKFFYCQSDLISDVLNLQRTTEKLERYNEREGFISVINNR